MARSRPININLDDEDFELLNRLFEAEIKKAKTIIAKTQKFPSYTISSRTTREKYNQMISQIEELQERLNTAGLC
jgi:flagellar basal body P-ring protein FlgI